MLTGLGLNPLLVAIISLALFVFLLYRMLRGARDQYYDGVRHAANARVDAMQNPSDGIANKEADFRKNRTPTLNVGNQALGIIVFVICGCIGACLFIKYYMPSDFERANEQLEQNISAVQSLC